MKPEIIVEAKKEEPKPEIKVPVQEVKPEVKVEEKKEDNLSAPRPRLRVSLKSVLPNFNETKTTPEPQTSTPQSNSQSVTPQPSSQTLTPQPSSQNLSSQSNSQTVTPSSPMRIQMNATPINNQPMIQGINVVEEEEDPKQETEVKTVGLNNSSGMLIVDSFSKKRSTSIKRDPSSKSLETYDETEEILILNALYQLEGLAEAKKEEKSIREISMLDENPLPTLAEEITSFELECGIFERKEFSFIEKPLPERKNKPIPFFAQPQIEEFEKIFLILAETKPIPEKMKNLSFMKSPMFSVSSKNLNELKKQPSSLNLDLDQEKLLKARQQGSGKLGSLAKSTKSVDVEYSPDFEPPFINPLYDPNALSELDQKKKNLDDEINRIIEEYEGVDIEMKDAYNLESDEYPTCNEEFYSNYVKRIEGNQRFEKKEKNVESKEKSILNPNSFKKQESQPQIKKIDDDYEDGDTSLASKKNPEETVKKMLIEVRNLKKRIQILESFTEHDELFLEDKSILLDYNCFDVSNSEPFDEIVVNSMFCDDEIMEHFQIF